MENNNNKKVIIGKIGAPFGVEGFVKVYSFTDPASNILEYKTWGLRKPKANLDWQVCSVLSAKPHGNIFVAKLENIATREDAALITNSFITINRDELPELNSGEYYRDDLIGFTVVNADGKTLGKVKDFFTTSANDIMVVKQDGEEHLIPYVEGHHIIAVDMESQTIKVDFEFMD